PTHTHTLSLHDALPIFKRAQPDSRPVASSERGAVLMGDAPAIGKVGNDIKRRPALRLESQRRPQIDFKLPGSKVNVVGEQESSVDRKSTRLNSSHEWIS